MTQLERHKIVEEARDDDPPSSLISAGILASEQTPLGIIKDEAADTQGRVWHERRTEIACGGPPELTLRTSSRGGVGDTRTWWSPITRSGYIKRTTFESGSRSEPRRGGKGRNGMETKEEDLVGNFRGLDALVPPVLQKQGKVHWLKVHEIP